MSGRSWQHNIALKLCVHFDLVACLRNSHLGMSFKEVVGMPSWNLVPPPSVCSLLTSELGMMAPALQTPSDAAEYVVWLHLHPPPFNHQQHREKQTPYHCLLWL